MIDVVKLTDLKAGPEVIQLANFLNDSANGKKFPDYKTLDLMAIPRLVPNIFCFDFSNGIDNDITFHFSGTKIDEQYGFNVSGHSWQKIYTGEHREILWNECYRRIVTDAASSYNRRTDFYVDDDVKKIRRIEAACFPCSKDGKTIDFGLGISIFKFPNGEIDNLFLSI